MITFIFTRIRVGPIDGINWVKERTDMMHMFLIGQIFGKQVFLNFVVMSLKIMTLRLVVVIRPLGGQARETHL